MVVLAAVVALEHRCEAAQARLNEIAQFLIPACLVAGPDYPTI
jgi:hypothetical protein